MEAVGQTNLSPSAQRQLEKNMQNMQMKDSLLMYTNLVHRCFGTCITSFRSKSLDKAEISCVENCASRYLKMTQRVGQRFAEHQAMQQKRLAEATAAGKVGTP